MSRNLIGARTKDLCYDAIVNAPNCRDSSLLMSAHAYCVDALGRRGLY
jgi:hypothetical protein